MGLLVSLVDATSIDRNTKKILRQFAEKIEYLETKQVTKDEFRELKEAQQRTEERLDKLIERVDALAQAQQKTEIEIRMLTMKVKDLDRKFDELSSQVGGLSHTIGYTLENEAIRALPGLLSEEGLVCGKLTRKWIKLPLREGKYKWEEINIYGECHRGNEELLIIGESKAQFGQKAAKEFLKKIKKMRKMMKKELFAIVIAHSIHPEAEEIFKAEEIKYYTSIELMG